MSDKKISQLSGAATPLAGTEVLPIVQNGSTVKVANNDLRPKQIQSKATSGVLQVFGPVATSIRVMTTPDADFTVARTDAAQTFTGDQTLATGNLVIGTSGKGIDFSATSQASGMTSEILSDYEQGTWTASITDTGGGTITLSSNQGYYVKVGRMVYVCCKIIVNSVSSPQSIPSVEGLPFVSANIPNASAAVSVYANGFDANATAMIQGTVDPNSSNIYLFQYLNGERGNNLASQFKAASILYISVTYITQ